MNFFDNFFEQLSRKVAQNNSRRSFVTKIGMMIIGSSVSMPILPISRAYGRQISSEKVAEVPDSSNPDDFNSCDYWRYCAVDGFLCSCCGGSLTTCPPGTTPSPVAWIGTCHNPYDGKDYIVSYNDCCGKTACGRCQCSNQVRERPGYQLFLHNDINWCMANENSIYHCTTSVVVGLAEN
jgi:aralkylamine dehydrogenase light chain/methylamine dehydrogenase light chain